jgi:hypothetical protein
MLHEGLAEFHQHSVWYFGVSCTPDPGKGEYTFPLITPGLARTLHLFLGTLTRHHSVKDEPFLHRDNIDEGWEDEPDYEEEDGLERYFWLP